MKVVHVYIIFNERKEENVTNIKKFVRHLLTYAE